MIFSTETLLKSGLRRQYRSFIIKLFCNMNSRMREIKKKTYIFCVLYVIRFSFSQSTHLLMNNHRSSWIGHVVRTCISESIWIKTRIELSTWTFVGICNGIYNLILEHSVSLRRSSDAAMILIVIVQLNSFERKRVTQFIPNFTYDSFLYKKIHKILIQDEILCISEKMSIMLLTNQKRWSIEFVIVNDNRETHFNNARPNSLQGIFFFFFSISSYDYNFYSCSLQSTFAKELLYLMLNFTKKKKEQLKLDTR